MISVLCQKENNHPYSIFAGPHLDCSYSHSQQLELVQACFHQSLSTKREWCWEGSFACFVRSSMDMEALLSSRLDPATLYFSQRISAGLS